ncbi:hypothetical protein [Vibrio splendidus]|uniref:hypothetical protein n=1 Tax=Vibrio splendidus TaxID=29497 RepID=UPI000D3CD157|nr:hypothetical protein [Vibrio splendidus]PTP95461.1 hypothetical protein CWO02_01060 [Vibrio splendidus]
MATPTWKSIGGLPNFSASNQLAVQGGNQIQQAIQGLSGLAQQQADNQQSDLLAQFESRVGGTDTAEGANALREQLAQSGLTGQNQRLANQSVDARLGMLDQRSRQVAQDQLAQDRFGLQQEQFAHQQEQADRNLVTGPNGGQYQVTYGEDGKATANKIIGMDEPAAGPADVFSKRTKLQDAEGNVSWVNQGKDGKLYDLNGNQTSIGGDTGLSVVDPTQVDVAKAIISDPNSSMEDKTQARQFLQFDMEQTQDFGNMGKAEFNKYVREGTQLSSDVGYIDGTLDRVDTLMELGGSRLGGLTRSHANRFAELLGKRAGDEEINREFAGVEAETLEIVRGIIRAFAPVSDTAMTLVIDSMKGKTFLEQMEAIKATRNSMSKDYDANAEFGSRMKVGSDYTFEPLGSYVTPSEREAQDVKAIENAANTNAATTNNQSTIQYSDEQMGILSKYGL